MERIGFVTGLKVEAACLAPLVSTKANVRVRCRGMGPDAAGKSAVDLVQSGVAALVSFGTAGGLDPALATGTIVIPSRVVTGEGAGLQLDTAWTERLRARLRRTGSSVHNGALLASSSPVATVAAKRALHARTGAVAVDMETGAIAAVAAERTVPFVAVRAIADDANEALPPWLLLVTTADGRTDVSGIARRLLTHPNEIPGFVRMARKGRRALAALRRVAVDSGADFVFGAEPLDQ